MAWRLFLFGVAIVVACSETSTPAAPGGGGTTPPSPTGGTGGAGAGAGVGGTGGGSGGGAGTTGTAGSGGQGGNAGAGGGLQRGACNSDDFMILAALVDPAEVRATSAGCANSPCQPLANDDSAFVACVANCVELAYTGLSEPCAVCYGELENCSNATCANECSGDASNACACPSSTPCVEAGYPQCQALWSDCTGPLPPECMPT